MVIFRFIIALTILAISFTLKAQNNIFINLVCKSPTSNQVSVRYNVNNPCGNLSEFYVFGSSGNSGVYNSIDTVTNLALNTIEFNANGSNRWLVYFQYKEACNGFFYSDTVLVDTEAPNEVFLDSVSVIGDDVIFGWSKSTSTDVEFYVPYWVDETNTNFIINKLDSDSTSYLDTNSDRSVHNEVFNYKIGVWDSCSNVTLSSKFHSTILLSLSNQDYCNKSLVFNRTDYKGWDIVEHYLVYRKKGDIFFKEFSSFTNNDLSLSLDTFTNDIYEFKVRARNPITSITSSSNLISINLDLESDIDNLLLWNTTVEGDSVVYKWNFTNQDYIKNLIFNWGNSIDNLNNTITLDTNVNSYSVYNNGGIYYGRIDIRSVCKLLVGSSNIQRNIKLNVTSTNNGESRFLEWNSFINYSGSVKGYAVFRRINNTWDSIAYINSDTLINSYKYYDEVVIDSEIPDGLCYKVLAYNNISDSIFSTSNIECYKFQYHKDIPNAFNPNSEFNNIWYLPAIGMNEELSIVYIYNRWGELVTEINKPFTEGWNGNFNNSNSNPCPKGLYNFHGIVNQSDNKRIYINGTIYLIR